jgi:ATP-dependent DNA helicase DinG
MTAKPMTNDYKEIFSADGPLAASIPGFAYRPEQAAMAKAVGQALALGEPLIVEAGTGTGKTFAYLVPALLSGRSVIISTGTRTLQDQLFHRDVPMLARAIGMPVRVALLKGRSNYLCRQHLDEATQQQTMFGPKKGAARHLAKIRRWSLTTRTGDLAELADIPEDSPVWPLVTSTRENCLGQECPQFSRCHVYDARRSAQAAQVVVVNHHLLLADMGLKDEGFGDLLPGAEALILDEAHQIPDIAAQFFGLSWSSRQVQVLARDTAVELTKVQDGNSILGDALRELEAGVHGLHRCLPSKPGRTDWERLPDSFFDALSDIHGRLLELGNRMDALGSGPGTAMCARRARQLAANLGTLRAVEERSGLRWVEVQSMGLQLHFTPFEIAERLRTYIDSRPCAWIFTSATLALGDDFSHFSTRIGLPDARSLRIDSPFDYGDQARVYLPLKMPEPQDPSYADRFIDACAPLLEASGGRAFLLYTSYRGLKEGVEALARRFPNPPFPVLVQGQAPRDALLKQFRALGNAVLLGTGSFWEGVDVKGDALSIVAIDKLPFASPDDPLLKARLEGIRRRGGNPFFEYQVPQAILALKQGVGRLIRDIDDFGVIVIGDPRVKTKGYGRMFLDSLPPSPVITDPKKGAEFLARRLAGVRRQ